MSVSHRKPSASLLATTTLLCTRIGMKCTIRASMARATSKCVLSLYIFHDVLSSNLLHRTHSPSASSRTTTSSTTSSLGPRPANPASSTSRTNHTHVSRVSPHCRCLAEECGDRAVNGFGSRTHCWHYLVVVLLLLRQARWRSISIWSVQQLVSEGTMHHTPEIYQVIGRDH